MTITLDKVSFSYSPGIPVLRDISFTLREGELILIVGRNGVGKSTLLKLLNGILKPTSGEISVAGLRTAVTPTSELAKHICVTFQNPSDQIFASTVREEIEFGSKNIGRANAEAIVENTVQLFGLSRLTNKHPYDLLPAQRKLLTIASAVAMETAALAFDEPTAGLSKDERLTVARAFKSLLAKRHTIVIVSHDLQFFLPLCNRVFVISGGEVKHESGPGEFLGKAVVLRQWGVKFPLSYRLQKLVG